MKRVVYYPPAPAGRAVYAMELMEPQPTDVVLDVGCFEGAIEYHLLRHRVKEVQGIDVNVGAVDRASAWARENSVSQAPAAQCQFQVAEAE